MAWDIREGDVLDRLREMPDESVQCVVTSPPYFGLRNYGVEGQIGLEATPDEHIAKLVEVFREVRRVLRSDGVLWVNYGDAYAGTGKSGGGKQGERWKHCGQDTEGPRGGKWKPAPVGLKQKDLIGLPWMLAFALRADGWWLRDAIVWHKPATMPESAKDRTTRSHEFIFLLTKRPRYFFDADAIREGVTGGANARRKDGKPTPKQRGAEVTGDHAEAGKGMSGNVPQSSRHARSVWSINPQPFSGAHFATFPEALPERCILAGTSAHGACEHCGAPWRRVVELGGPIEEQQRACGGDASGGYSGEATKAYADARAQDPSAVKARILAGMRERQTLGWVPTCDCNDDDPLQAGFPRRVRPCVVLDPFAGAGTTLLVAERLGRDSIGVELNPEYAAIARARIRAADPFEAQEVVPGRTQHSLFGRA